MNFRPFFWAGLAIGAALAGVAIAVLNAIFTGGSCA
jgi:hypothetical protein